MSAEDEIRKKKQVRCDGWNKGRTQGGKMCDNMYELRDQRPKIEP